MYRTNPSDRSNERSTARVQSAEATDGRTSIASNRPRDDSSAATPIESTVGDVRSGPDGDTEGHEMRATTLLAPFVVSTTYVGAIALGGARLFDTSATGVTSVTAYLLLGSLLVLSGYATSRLYTDIQRIRQLDGRWQPSARRYVGGGAIVLVGVRIGELLVTGRPVSTPVLYLVGNAVVALPLASIVAGPIYWLRRRHHDDANKTRRCENNG
ncbi:MAG: hypothetical protein ACQETB_02055 [Halobacteriota archaeon]